MLEDLEVAIFSYNRGKYLKNCIESVLEHLPGAKITVFDDYSDDPETVAYLQSLGEMFVLGSQAGNSRHGNLYHNMQLALQHSSRRFLLLLQDDLQVLRTLKPLDMEHMQQIFHDPDIAFLRPQFMKFSDGIRNTELLDPSTALRAYLPKASYSDNSFVHAYSDIVLCDTPKLKKLHWQFAHTERKNQIQALKYFKHMPFMADSFIFYCPEVPCYRNKKLLLASKIVQKKLKGKISAYHPLTEEQNKTFTQRSIHIWPIAEDFLTATINTVVKPFVYQDYKKTFWLRSLYKLERGLDKFMQCTAFLFKK
ncbi:MAG: glycosyltransferase family A protein [Methyloprofundus sp.]|nr:glycosyltransferase family A protein [Methyloprofundus sp.]